MRDHWVLFQHINTNLNRTEIISPGFFSFSSKYEVYIIKILQSGNVVKRRQTCFDELRGVLVKLYPGCAVPPLPRKPINRLEQEFLDKRKKKLQKFIDDILIHPVLRTSDLVWKFLTLSDDKSYDKSVRDNEAIPRPSHPSECITIEGRAKITCSHALAQSCSEAIVGIKEIHGSLKS